MEQMNSKLKSVNASTDADGDGGDENDGLC
jgi:hypothetical protein